MNKKLIIPFCAFSTLFLVATFVFVQINVASAGSYAYDPPLRFWSATSLIESILNGIYAIVGWLALVMIVIGGIVYIASGGNQKQMDLAKAIVTWALVGFAIAVATPTIMNELKGLAEAGGGTTELPSVTKEAALQRTMSFVLTAFVILAAISFVVAGIIFLIAGANQTLQTKAKSVVLYSIIAVVIASSALVIINELADLIGFTVVT